MISSKLPRIIKRSISLTVRCNADVQKWTPPVEDVAKIPPYNLKRPLKGPTKESLKWRRPITEKPGEFYSKFKVFEPAAPTADFITWIQQPIDLRPSAFRRWYLKRQEQATLLDQMYIPARNAVLGNELAAAHFIVHRGGAVKFYGQDKWIKQDENNEYELPSFYSPEYLIEEIDCRGMTLLYEGLENLQGLKIVKKINFSGCERMDDWCLDRISGQFRNSLVELDITNCPQITEKGLGALYKLKKLRKLHTNKRIESKSFELTCLLLEETNPRLKIDLATKAIES